MLPPKLKTSAQLLNFSSCYVHPTVRFFSSQICTLPPAYLHQKDERALPDLQSSKFSVSPNNNNNNNNNTTLDSFALFLSSRGRIQ